MTEHPISSLMKTAMESIKEMVDVNTVIGDPVNHQGGVIIPVSRVSFGFAAGGGEYESRRKSSERLEALPFAGGSGAGVSVQPVGFLVVHDTQVRLLPVDHNDAMDRVIDAAPDMMDRLLGIFRSSDKHSETKKRFDAKEEQGVHLDH